MALKDHGGTDHDVVSDDGISRDLVVVRDPLPANVEFLNFVETQNATPLYHLNGMGPESYSSNVSPLDFVNVDKIAFGLPQLAVDETFTFSFSVRINDNARGAIENIATSFEANNRSMKRVFAETALHCMGN